MQYKKILVPTDGSDVSLEAIEHAVSIAKTTGAEIFGVYVLDTTPYTEIPADGLWSNLKEILEEEGDNALHLVAKAARKYDVAFKNQVLEGNPEKEIVEFADKINADLIVMGTTGKTGFDRLLLGSVAERVLKHTKCPVLLVRQKE
ncbi:universal stress protein [Methanococcus voltae]|uniref:UspA domain protein n=1 Tax=Methanococcus voltae (strain ATCC BAA-1334 / A3) TaxID=456320 RepID=D7DTG3_METV3|nr:universal stress protein [Methanococcus voltae]MCS3901275.1 nucleotide-binding universal stress UspA family protein [Methanococcus voltae]